MNEQRNYSKNAVKEAAVKRGMAYLCVFIMRQQHQGQHAFAAQGIDSGHTA